MSAPRYPQPRHVPDARAILEVFNRTPLVEVLRAFASYPLVRCPRPSCASPRVSLHGGANFVCWTCGLCSCGGAFAAGFLWDWTFDQVAGVLDLERVGREGC